MKMGKQEKEPPSNGVVHHTTDDDVETSKDKKSKCDCNCLKKVSDAIINALETCFYKCGCGIGQYPWVVMLCCVIFTVAMVPGILFFFNEETQSENLWVPIGSQSLKDKAFVDENFSTSLRFEAMIVEAPNVLTPAVIQAMLDIDIAVKAISGTGYDWNSLCYKRGGVCWSSSLLELWSFNEAIIRSLSQADILNTINTVTTSPVYYNSYNVEQVLGEITRDGNGAITGAKATTMTWFLTVTGSDQTDTPQQVLDWETDFLKIGEAGNNNIEQLYYFAGRSFEEAGNSIGNDIIFLSSGYILVIVFVAIVLGRFSKVHHRIYMTFSAIVCIGMAIAVSFGLSSYIGLDYGPVHSILPFLFLGIGIDDTFVICQSLDSLGPETHDLPLHKRMGLTLKHAGVSITVTSLTDILAFAVGSSTILPALRSFCGFAAIGIFAIYLFQATFLLACLTYDQKRIMQTRNACCCCYVHKDYEPSECSKNPIVQKVFDKFYGPLLIKLPFKIVVVIIAAGLFGVCIWGTIKLEQDFDFLWFLPSDSYARKYFDAQEDYFPSNGVSANVYFADINYYNDYNTLRAIHLAVDGNKYVASTDSWYYSYMSWVSASTDPAVIALTDPNKFPSSESNFYTLLNMYMFAAPYEGARFAGDVKFGTNGKIKASRTSFQYNNLENAQEEVKAMDSIRNLIKTFGYTNEECFAYSEQYLGFEANKVIQNELYRNLGLAFLCVFIMTLLLLANLWTCLLVCLSVIMSLVNVGGFMYFWGLTIDTVTSINLIVAIGLTVDYAAHIAHTFMVSTGNRDERVVKMMSLIGPAVFYGGFSTFLAFLLLSASTSYVFTVFFKVFFLVVLFGMFHGMVFVPVILSWIGPNAYGSAGVNPIAVEQSVEPHDGVMKNPHVPEDMERQNGAIPSKPIHSDEGFDNFAADVESSPPQSSNSSPKRENITPVAI